MPAPAPCAKTKQARADRGDMSSAETRWVSSTVRVADLARGGFTLRMVLQTVFATGGLAGAARGGPVPDHPARSCIWKSHYSYKYQEVMRLRLCSAKLRKSCSGATKSVRGGASMAVFPSSPTHAQLEQRARLSEPLPAYLLTIGARGGLSSTLHAVRGSDTHRVTTCANEDSI